MASRWYPQTLSRRILDIAAFADRIRFIEGDGLEILRDYHDRPGAVAFIDPPYPAAGKRVGARLYRHSELDHDALFESVRRLPGDFLMTYDDTAELRERAARFGFVAPAIPMKSTHHARMTELLIGRDLCWA